MSIPILSFKTREAQPASMAQICLLDFAHMSKLLEEALSWSPAASSILVSACNGSILAYAFRSNTPSIKDMRTLSTTMTAAYIVASENTLVYESQSSNTISVVGPVADHVLLVVTGTTAAKPPGSHTASTDRVPREGGREADMEDDGEEGEEEEEEEEGEGEDCRQAETRLELESLSQELATILREELRDMKWPDDI